LCQQKQGCCVVAVGRNHTDKEKGYCVVALEKISMLDNEKVVVSFLLKKACQLREGCSVISLEKTKHASK